MATSTPAALAQLFLRIALAIGFISPVLDRFGLWGPPGTPNVGWGAWKPFCDYAYTLMFFLPRSLSDFFAAVATAAEVLFGIQLLVGWKIRWAALGSGILTLTFALCMTLALGVHAPLNYSVFAVSAGSFLLATLPGYPWSIDAARPGAR